MGRPEESVDNSNVSQVDGVTSELSYEDKLKCVTPISQPMASKKLTKKVCKLMKKGKFKECDVSCNVLTLIV